MTASNWNDTLQARTYHTAVAASALIRSMIHWTDAFVHETQWQWREKSASTFIGIVCCVERCNSTACDWWQHSAIDRWQLSATDRWQHSANDGGNTRLLTGGNTRLLTGGNTRLLTGGNTRLLTKQARWAALHEKLLINNFPKFCNAGIFTAVFTTAHH